MGLTGPQLEQTFGTGFSAVKFIKGFNHPTLNQPATPVTDPTADAVEQQVPVDVIWDATTRTLMLTHSPAGSGLWIPYLGNGLGRNGDKGWGSYSKAVGAETWVATGPFSGCFVASFLGDGRRFAHLITPAAGYTAATVDAQLAAIAAASRSETYTKWPMDGAGLGLAFFLKLPRGWHRRFVWVAPGGSVMQMNAKSVPI